MKAPVPVQHFTLADIAEALGVSKQSAWRKAKREGWSYTTKPARGGRQFMFLLEDMPKKVARRVAAKQAVLAVKASYSVIKEVAPDLFILVVGGEVFEVRRLPA